MDIQDPGFRFAPPWASGVYHAFGVPLRSELLKLPYCRAFFYAVGVRSAGLLSSRPSRLRQGFVGQAGTVRLACLNALNRNQQRPCRIWRRDGVFQRNLNPSTVHAMEGMVSRRVAPRGCAF